MTPTPAVDIVRAAMEFLGAVSFVDTEVNPERIQEACEAFFLNGFADEVSGNAECITGHFYRVDRWIVVTDGAGKKSLREYETERGAMSEFDKLDQEYAKWANEYE